MGYLSPLLMIAMAGKPTAAAPPAVPPCVEEVNALLQREDFAGVLLAAERCGVKTAHPRAFYFAGVARIGLGQHAHAILELQRYLANDAPDEPKRLREVAGSRLVQAKAQSVPVLLRIAALDGEDEIRVTAEPEVQSGEPIRTPWTALEERDGGRVLWLDPGRYRVTIRDGGQLTATRPLTVVTGGAEIVLNVSLEAPVAAVAPPSPPPVFVFPRRAWFAVTGSTGGVNVLAGLSVLSLGWVQGNRQFGTSATSCQPITSITELDRCRGIFAEVVTRYGAGAGLLGAGLGVFAGSLTALVQNPARRKLVWRIEVGIGGGVLLTGAVLLGVGLRNFNHLNTDASSAALLWGGEYRDRVSERADQYAAGAGLVGAGIGLGTTAALGLLVQRLVPVRTAAARRWQVQSQGLAIAF
jgi:hypothetical protein